MKRSRDHDWEESLNISCLRVCVGVSFSFVGVDIRVLNCYIETELNVMCLIWMLNAL